VTRKYEGGRTSDERHEYYRAKKRKLLERRKCIFFLKNNFGVDLQVFLEMLSDAPNTAPNKIVTEVVAL
jgi:hypothetical protein